MPRLVGLVIALMGAQIARGGFPNTFPYIDTCSGVDVSHCNQDTVDGQCHWFTDQYPWCFDERYATIQPRSVDQIGLATKFFTFNAGVHLSEGTHQKFFYNLSPDECAAECLRSAGVCPANIRCLSFDFYPFEDPKPANPWLETALTGVCVINSENRDSARLRNSDLGYSDASLFYRAHFSYLPFSDSEGYYELRDPRGNQLSTMLDYPSLNSSVPAAFVSWGGSRWGMYTLVAPVPQSQNIPSECPPIGPATIDPYVPVRYFGGYTPVNQDQKCPGLVTRSEAEALCAYSGGQLCTSDELDALVGLKLGCGFDGPVRGKTLLRDYPLWSSEDPVGATYLKYPRCCGSYSLLDSCQAYQQPPCPLGYPDCPYSTCSIYTTATDCVQQASGTARQNLWGMGNFVDKMRQDCQEGAAPCKGMYLDWTPRDQCVWCPAPGAAGGGGAGECRVGSSLAICNNAPDVLRTQWTAVLKSQCTRTPTGSPVSVAEVVCRMIANYPDLSTLMAPPEPPPAPTTRPTTTASPTFQMSPPICNATQSPTMSTASVGGLPWWATTCYALKGHPVLCPQKPGCVYIKNGRCVPQGLSG